MRYPAAVLVGLVVPGPRIAAPVDFQNGPGPLYGPKPVPMMGVGSPHATEARN